MRSRQWTLIGLTTVLVSCGYGATTNVQTPLGAFLTSHATTGAPVPLRVDPNARVILSGAVGLPAASFLPSQAQRGKRLYAQSCGPCHDPGQLIGQAFVESWSNRRVYDLYALVRATMPIDNPGGMKDAEYLDVITYLLQANRHTPAGADSLSADTLVLRTRRIAVSFP